jgi:hypothetical protein
VEVEESDEGTAGGPRASRSAGARADARTSARRGVREGLHCRRAAVRVDCARVAGYEDACRRGHEEAPSRIDLSTRKCAGRQDAVEEWGWNESDATPPAFARAA